MKIFSSSFVVGDEQKMHFHFLLQSSQKFSRLPSSLAMNKNAFPFSSSVIAKIFLSSFVVGDEQKMHFHFLLQSSQKFSRPPSSVVMNKKCISIFFAKIFSSKNHQKKLKHFFFFFFYFFFLIFFKFEL